VTFIEHLSKVYCRIGVSKIHGVGVIAIRDIPKGINPMEEITPAQFDEVDSKLIYSLPGFLRDLVLAMCPERDGVFDVPSQGLNSLGVAWYLNHSDAPNMEERDGEFFSLVPIAAGTELTVDYGTYGKLNL
jgi:SET domain